MHVRRLIARLVPSPSLSFPSLPFISFRVCCCLDAYFKQTIPPQELPTWPLSRYSSYRFVNDLEGPASYVLDNPYSIALAFVSVAAKLGVKSVSLKNPYGSIVRPNFDTLSAGLNERTVGSQQNDDGSIGYSYNRDINLAAGPNVWPFMLSITLIVSKEFSTQSCVGRR
jgi:hypothetical protein